MTDNIDEEIKAEKPDNTGRKPDGTFGPGNCANPHGRPRTGTAISDLMREYLDGEFETEAGKLKRKEAFVRAVFKQAMQGSTAAQRMVWDHLDGMPRQKVEQLLGSLGDDRVELIIGGRKVEGTGGAN